MFTRKHVKRGLAGTALAVCIGGIFLLHPLVMHVRATVLLAKFAGETRVAGLPTILGNYHLTESEFEFPSETGPVKARLYVPDGVTNPGGVVMVHGVHRDGFNEPRMVSFARAVAGTGVAVMTPMVKDLADYQVAPQSIETIGSAARALRQRLGGVRQVGVMGMCFGGGLSLMAAADQRFADDIGFVLCIGAHDDMARVAKFFITDQIERPDGTTARLKADPYGPMVIVYGYVEDFFDAADAPAARDALRLWLWGEFDAARKRSEALSPTGREKVNAIFDQKCPTLGAEISALVARKAAFMKTISPETVLPAVHAQVFLLHGAADAVVPPSETLWLARGLQSPAQVLVSRAIGHVELGGDVTWREKWDLLHFLADVIDRAGGQ